LIKGLRRQTALNLEVAREEAQFSDLEDLVRRVKLRKDEIETLAEAGALEGLVPGRRQALWAARAPRGMGLFEGVGSRERPVVLPPVKAADQLILDYSRVGLSIDDHPMCHWRSELRANRVVRACDLADIKHESQVTVAGLVLSRQRPGTASGVVFITLEDETGTMNLVLFAQVYERFRLAAKHATLMLVTGKLERQVTLPRPGEVGRPTPTLHVIVQQLERLDVPEHRLRHRSRDFH
jgi:error-prone DNA polymerase